MKLDRNFTDYLNADLIQQIAQELYDNGNYRGLTADEFIMLKACKDTYKELRGEDIQLTYNCPA